MPRKSLASQSSDSEILPVPKKITRRPASPKPAEPASAYVSRSESPRSRSRNSGSSVGVVITFLMLLILVAGAYFAVMYFKNKSAEEVAIQEAEMAAAAQAQADAEAEATKTAEKPPVDPAANWESFALPDKSASTTGNLFSFKYPVELQLTQKTNNIILSSETVSTTQLTVNWVKNAKTLAEYLTALDKANAKGWEGKPAVSVTTSTDAVVISGQPAVFRQQNILAANLQQYVTYVKSGENIYAISLAAPQLDQNLLGFFVTFVNNFKFGQ